MNRRKFFKGFAALPLAFVPVQKAEAAPIGLDPRVVDGIVKDLNALCGFVLRDVPMYLHRGEQRVTFVLPPGRGSNETQRQIAARNRKAH